MQDPIDRIAATVRSSRTLRLLVVGALVLLLQIPVAMIGRLVHERQERRLAAATEIAGKWGGAQTIVGPALIVPYSVRITTRSADGSERSHEETRHATILPERLELIGTLDSELRRRGIFSVPVFTLEATVEGEFRGLDLAELGVDPSTVRWDRAHLAIGVSDARAIQRATAVQWNGRERRFVAGPGRFAEAGGSGIHAPVEVSPGTDRVRFSLPLALNGSSTLSFTPFGQTTNVELGSDYGHPSFQGNWLPTERRVSARGFEARWSIPALGRNYPQAWTSDRPPADSIGASAFGVDVFTPVDHYRMAERSVKYAGLFLLLTFTTVWLVEVLAGVRVHPIQYLMLGGALCLFYLLELSLSEQVGFPAAYALATVAVVAMTAGFCRVALRVASRAAMVAAGVALLYGYLYVVLTSEDYALLIGAIGLFLALAATMFATRRVDWYGARPTSLAGTPSA